MPISTQLPIKFSCRQCAKMYMAPYSLEHFCAYPNCPNCQLPGQLLGLAEKADIAKYPLTFAKAYLKQSLPKLNMSR